MTHNVAVVGLGKVGLPLAVQYASKGAKVTGCDINPDVVASVNAGETPIKDEDRLPETLAAVVESGHLCATTDTAAAVRAADIVVVIVPLMVDAARDIDFRMIDAATEAVGAGLGSGTTVIFETTLPVGTTRGRIATTLGRVSGLVAGRDFHVAFSPERIRTGRIFRDLATYPKVVGGLTPKCTEHAAAFYESVLDAEVMRVSSAEAAELTKLIETTFRDVNIALANEFAIFASGRGLDVHEAIAAANSQPQSMIHEPGIGVGGHCIPVYPYFMLNHAAPDELRLARTARQVNDAMPAHALSVVDDALAGMVERRALVLGLSYRANVKEAAFSMTFGIVEELERRGIAVDVCDPLFTPEEIAARGLCPVAMDALQPYPLVVIQAFHREFDALPTAILERADVVIDGRGDLQERARSQNDQVILRIGTPIQQSKQWVVAQKHR